MFKYTAVLFTALMAATFYLQSAPAVDNMDTNNEVATLAGGCFWCVESDLEKLKGVSEVISGYTDGHVAAPTYQQVSSGKSGHVESVEVHFDPQIISYEKVLDAFWRHINPTDNGGQFVDRGEQYKPYIFYHTEKQRIAAEQSRYQLSHSGRYNKPITTEIKKVTRFWPAEEYHQDYYKKNPIRYHLYRYNSGRDQYLEDVWSKKITRKVEDKSMNQVSADPIKYHKPSDKALHEKLTTLQYKVTQKEATERPFDNEYWDEKREGIYVDIASGEPLFSSKDKFKSGTGWPSFTKPIESENIIEKKDSRLFYSRTEVRSKFGDSHLGHLFNDGPEPTRLRYCINSAALKFVPKESLESAGYQEFLAGF